MNSVGYALAGAARRGGAAYSSVMNAQMVEMLNTMRESNLAAIRHQYRNEEITRSDKLATERQLTGHNQAIERGKTAHGYAGSGLMSKFGNELTNQDLAAMSEQDRAGLTTKVEAEAESRAAAQARHRAPTKVSFQEKIFDRMDSNQQEAFIALMATGQGKLKDTAMTEAQSAKAKSDKIKATNDTAKLITDQFMDARGGENAGPLAPEEAFKLSVEVQKALIGRGLMDKPTAESYTEQFKNASSGPVRQSLVDYAGVMLDGPSQQQFMDNIQKITNEGKQKRQDILDEQKRKKQKQASGAAKRDQKAKGYFESRGSENKW